MLAVLDTQRHELATRLSEAEQVRATQAAELQRRGVFRERYTGATLRENLGLERPASTLF